jgi:hypothetical protein
MVKTHKQVGNRTTVTPAMQSEYMFQQFYINSGVCGWQEHAFDARGYAGQFQKCVRADCVPAVLSDPLQVHVSLAVSTALVYVA